MQWLCSLVLSETNFCKKKNKKFPTKAVHEKINNQRNLAFKKESIFATKSYKATRFVY